MADRTGGKNPQEAHVAASQTNSLSTFLKRSLLAGSIGLLVIVLELLAITVVLFILSLYNVTIPTVPEIPLRNPSIMIFVFAVLLFSIVWARAVEKIGHLSRATEFLVSYIWEITSRKDTGARSAYERFIHTKARSEYLDVAGRQLGVLAFTLISPWIISYTYLSEYNLTVVTGLYIIYAVVFGGFESAFRRSFVNTGYNTYASSEVTDTISTQFEALLLIAAAITQVAD